MTSENVDAPLLSYNTPVDTKRAGGVASVELSAPVQSLLGLDGQKHNYNSLGNAIAKLPKDLSSDDVAALRDMLTWPNDRFPEGMRDIEINAVKNDVLDRLLRQNTLPEGIGLQLAEMASNPDNDPVWRDYCVQFMQPFYERYSDVLATKSTKGHEEDVSQAARLPSDAQDRRAAGGTDTDELGAVQEAMFAALDERDSTIAGTSLIGLELLSRTHDEFDREAITDSALEIASDESASAASRMTALRLSSNLAIKTTKAHENESFVSSDVVEGEINSKVADAARLLAQTGETVLLRSAALVTLGEVGNEDDRELLESYILDSNRQIADAARLALEKMDAPDEVAVDRSVPTVVEETTSTQPAEKLPPVLIN
ncbi:MAG: hypothetical protein JXR25_09780 [Pontiellaceae bacterium]|nr:hypothetical protein [Pontiellaceae bacterium]MBN2785106.1 hypothetical protein [Pontiellaceae bacterium]